MTQEGERGWAEPPTRLEPTLTSVGTLRESFARLPARQYEAAQLSRAVAPIMSTQVRGRDVTLFKTVLEPKIALATG